VLFFVSRFDRPLGMPSGRISFGRIVEMRRVVTPVGSTNLNTWCSDGTNDFAIVLLKISVLESFALYSSGDS
jgi:hypothetical protein